MLFGEYRLMDRMIQSSVKLACVAGAWKRVRREELAQESFLYFSSRALLAPPVFPYTARRILLKVARTSFPRARARQTSYPRGSTREESKQIWRRSALFAKGYFSHFEKKFVFTRDWITKKVLIYFKIWKKSASGAQCSCFRYKFASVL